MVWQADGRLSAEQYWRLPTWFREAVDLCREESQRIQVGRMEASRAQANASVGA